MADTILVIDDEQNYLLVLSTLLEDQGYNVTAIPDPETALAYLEESEVDVVITDMKMPKLSGQHVLEHVRRNYPQVPVLIMTAFGSIEAAVEAMRVGAFDYISKPFSNDELLLSVAKAVQFAHARQQNRLLLESMSKQFGVGNIIGGSRPMRRVLEMIQRAGPSRSTVLVSGESGTGKELVARAIHLTSPRKDQPFVSVNCMALNPGVMESELFGHEKGSFTGAVARKRGRFELADGGTLFLDEIGELSHETQVKLLRVLQERRFERVGGVDPIEVDIRVVAATNKNLQKAVSEGIFREDLFYRLNVVHIEMPPLRERREDIPLLAMHFLHKFSRENQKIFKGFTPDALNYLQGFDWPGNVRQLENVIERSVVLADAETIGVEDLPAEIKDEEAQYKSAVDMLPTRINLPDTLEKIEAALIRRALAKSEFVQVKAAELLGVSKSLLAYKLKKYKIVVH
ncbi:sigma-54 dependent transcriptional regulator [Desulfocurvibacter africanus]|uniref:Two component, sigma54 specific, transcriptional regulator, Fis family n=1 Tax=Desulfocurvibacter africanus subsp. africanus str. Walvis Bay TaxID=690850 RepID=F3YWD3_DESAF|nr:sigma-54 dependent transcriptional regulator [Desulfocurvibacter africanus]EGJ49319.1 two component, sigma54 specific, transcriptional regulator, Fis family [Desulfocurvibacter africanus subsp. africanus str. Walvis Bay]